ncbi:MAG TPA: hypothetical protein VG754_09365 [Verrucomicrobiae bacterium]|nr:hypothetical protein [Verrucomicrobiae bacterium]
MFDGGSYVRRHPLFDHSQRHQRVQEVLLALFHMRRQLMLVTNENPAPAATGANNVRLVADHMALLPRHYSMIAFVYGNISL